MENFNDTLASIENALKENTINEGQYIKLMNLAKKRFDKQNEIEDEDENDEVEIVPIKSHGDIMLAHYDNILQGNYIVINTAESTIHEHFHRQSDAEVYYKELAGI